jgi:hypothetical protein
MSARIAAGLAKLALPDVGSATRMSTSLKLRRIKRSRLQIPVLGMPLKPPKSR